MVLDDRQDMYDDFNLQEKVKKPKNLIYIPIGEMLLLS